MPANYPAGIPDFNGEIGDQPGDTLAHPKLTDWAKHITDELQAVCVELGVDPSEAAATVKSRLAFIESDVAPMAAAINNLNDAVAALTANPTSGTTAPQQGVTAYRRGVALAGHEFGTDQLADTTWFRSGNPGVLGTDYFLPSNGTWAYLKNRGVDTVRLAVRWERIQPGLAGVLSTVEMGRIDEQVGYAAANGIRVILDIHNYGRFWAAETGAVNGRREKLLGGAGAANLPDNTLVDLWTRLSARYANNPAVWAYGLMNEPHDFPDTVTPGGYTIGATRHTFDATVEGWGGGSGAVTVDTVVKRDGAASLKATQTFTGTGYQQFRVDDGQGAANRTLTGQGLTVSGWVRVPAGTPGNWFAQWRVYSSAFVDTAGVGSALIGAAEKDTWVQVTSTFTAAQLTDCRNLILQVNTDGGLPTAGTYSVNVDTVTQGSVAAGASTTGRQRWHQVSQACVAAVRNQGDSKLIMVAGYQYGGVQGWANNNGTVKWIVDSAANHRYEAHHYFDADNSGDYTAGETYAQTLTAATAAGHAAGGNADALHTRVQTELAVFTGWLTANSVKGYVGEVGWNNTADTAAWNALGERWYDLADLAGLDVTYWAAWPLSGYNLAVYDPTVNGAALNRALTPAAVVETHPTSTVTPEQVGTPEAQPAPAQSPGQPIVLGVTVANITLPAQAQVTMTATAADRDYTGVLFDVELFKDGVKVAQEFRQGLTLTKNVPNVQTFNVTVPGAGAYTITAGVFDQPAGGFEWGTKRAFYDNIASFQAAPAPVYTPPAGGALYRAPQTVNQYVAAYPEFKVIADQPQGLWLGEWSGNIQSAAATVIKAAGTQTAVFVAYNIPGRDNGNYSAGGLSGPAAYATWIDQLAVGLGSGNAVVVLEPDALGLSPALGQTARTERITMIRNAVARLKQQTGVKVYVDASTWISPQDMANMLAQVKPLTGPGLDGFSLNVSGYNPLGVPGGPLTTDGRTNCHAWAGQVSSLSGGLHYVVDTSRNGKGTANDWCNPPGQGLGKKPTAATGVAVCDYLLWIKAPGESDGQCNGGPSAGTFWIEKAQELVRNAVF